MSKMLKRAKNFVSIARFHRTPPMKTSPVEKVDKNCLNLIRSKIQMCGPMTVADYMKEVFMNPSRGYYMTNDVFGPSGDFTTSPEISQLFGEMIAVWCLNEWQKLGKPKPHNLIELGPGRGTMMHDILRVYNKIGMKKDDLSVHLVEMSDALSKIQAKKLCSSFKEGEGRHYLEGTTHFGFPIYWYYNVESIPTNFSVFLAHEFFDALPIHKFKKTEEGWREVLIDITENGLRYVISKNATPASHVFTRGYENRSDLEISPKAATIMQHIGQKLEKHGGFFLVADYGHIGNKEDTFRAFKNHKQHDPLVDPGTADLTADVDFSFLKNISDKLIMLGPVAQHDFLKSLQIDVRLDVLLKDKSEEERQEILSGYHTIMDKDKMGECFKFVSFFPNVLKEFLETYPAVGFEKP